MFDLFRFFILRPPEKPADDNVLALDNKGDFIRLLADARQSDKPRTGMQQVSEEFIHSDAFVADEASLNYVQQLQQFYRRLQGTNEGNLNTLNQLITGIFDRTPAELINEARFQNDKQRLQNSLIAVKIRSTSTNALTEMLSLYIHVIDLIERVAAGDHRLNTQEAIVEILNLSIALPPRLFPLPLSDTPITDTSSNQTNSNNQNDQQRQQLLQRYEQLSEAHRILTTLNPEDFAVTEASVNTHVSEGASNMLVQPSQVKNEVLLGESSQAHNVLAAEQRIAGLMPLSLAKVSGVGGSNLLLSNTSLERFSPKARSILAEIHADPATTSLPVVMDRLTSELSRIISIAALNPNVKVSIIGSSIVKLGDMFAGVGHVDLPDPNPPILPTTHGTVKPVGVGDLLVVKQQLIGYEPGEVAYIENILKGEAHKREVHRSETIEVSQLTEQESTQEEERDLQTTERFELRRESENVASIDGQLKGSGFSSPTYGGAIEFQNNNQSQLNGSQQIAERSASTYGKDVTSRAVSKITQKTRTQITRRTVSLFEERDEHDFENKDGAENVTGVYQWVDKVYQAQVYNYGKRLFYDLVVPEPAAFLLQAFSQSQATVEPFVLSPDQITEWNYAHLIAKYGATGVEPPPPFYQIVSKAFTAQSADKNFISQSFELPLPKDYVAYGDWNLTWEYLQKDQPAGGVNIVLGSSLIVAANTLQLTKLHSEVGVVPVLISAYNVIHVSVAIDIYCKRTEETFIQWQIQTYEKILQAYQQRKNENEERNANLQAALRLGALGQNADQKRVMEKTELKRSCISVFTYQYYDLFNGINDTDAAFPQIKLPAAEAQGAYIRFFEEAFEWEQIMYRFYPYFWGRKSQWASKITADESDPLFAEFLKAGAARVLVPVRPGFEKALLHFVETGQIWEGGEPPEMGSPTYLPLLNEMKEQQMAPETEVPYGAPWQFKMPTALVKLRADGKLPAWKQQDGKWVADE